jgi:hypothetical protein
MGQSESKERDFKEQKSKVLKTGEVKKSNEAVVHLQPSAQHT